MINFKLISMIFALAVIVSCSNIDNPSSNDTSESLVEIQDSVYSIEGLVLNDGEKWPTDKETAIGFKKMLELITVFNENPTPLLSDYNQFGVQMDEIKGEILNQCTMTGVAHDHLHTLLIPLIRKINGIKEASDIEKGREIYSNIQRNVELYDDYFEK